MRLIKWIRDLLSTCLEHPLSLTGTVVASVSAALIVTILLLDLFGFHTNPYVGVLVFMILPAALFFGLVLIPAGILRLRRRRSGQAEAYPVINLNLERHRGRFLAFSVLSFVNLVILATVSYKGVEHMDSVEFCGQTCHSVMEPEYSTYQRSPHSRVACVECHIGPGAGWFVKSKLSGVGQVFAVAFQTFDRPIPTPIENLRPARDTCEQCHWPEKFHGDRIRVKTTYAEDAGNTELKSVMILKVGGGSAESGIAEGIHWHMNIANEITYVPADRTREVIPFVRMKTLEGEVVDYVSGGAEKPTPEEIRERGRVMDCVDCHNRPTHIYRLPGWELDEAIRAGRIDRAVPWVRKAGLEVLNHPYESRASAREEIPRRLEEYYRAEHPEVLDSMAEAVKEAGRELATIHAQNVWPEMGIPWGVYPNHIGHTDSPGCFRCHDGEHESEDGRVISAECDTCHTLLAMEEENPEILAELFPE